MSLRNQPERASAHDAEEIAALLLAARADALPYLRRVHSDNEVREWVHNVLLERTETWVARSATGIVGFISIAGDSIDHLYVLPGHYRAGIGSALLSLAKERRPHRLRLFTFARNDRARAFYEAHAFRAVDTDDGSRNEEQEPDIQYAWTSSRIDTSRKGATRP